MPRDPRLARRAACARLVGWAGAAALWVAGRSGAALAAGEDGARAVLGTWRGPWYLGMSSGTATLVLAGDATLEGSLQLTNSEGFGDAPVPLRDVAIVDGKLRFVAIGADGQRMVADVPVDLDKGRLKGFVTWGGYKVRLELQRQPRAT
jgi:hypothetical protein